ncbi:MAG: bifunctional DNA primase/polymerase, partial [Candidatus Aenigmarchaeota archaeon]|nr:bifunctional DNA primase/polymerase [Candidatus Aenigmarchaeota archaeon]
MTPNCHEIGKVAKCFLRGGFSIVPVKANGKEPSIKWSDYKTNLMNEGLVQEFFNRDSNVALVTGRVSNITVLDVDNLNKFAQFYKLDKLKKECGTIVKTPKGLHFWFKYDSKLQTKQHQSFGFD